MSRQHKSLTSQLDEFELLCLSRGKKLSLARREVLSALLSKQKCMKAYELLEDLVQRLPNAKPVTIYRALSFLEKEGFIHRLDAINGWVVCHNIHSHHHDLLVVCTQCGYVSELSAPYISQQLHALIQSAGFVQDDLQTEIRATCQRCQEN